MVRWRALLFGLLAIAAGCSAPAASDPGELGAKQREAVTQGATDPGDPAVVAIVTLDNKMNCTGALIGPHTVLTAAHCQIGPSNFGSYRVFFGSDLGGQGTLVDVTDARIDPAFDPSTFAHDLGVLTLAQAGPATPLPVDPSALDSSLVGQTFRVVGFGMTTADAGDQGHKREGTADVAGLDPLDFTTRAAPSQPCVFDSGGPALFSVGNKTFVTGVVSHGDTGCSDHAAYARIDVEQASFLQPYLAQTAPGTAKPGERCLYKEQCGQGVCLAAQDDPRITYCSTSCAGGSPCPAGMVCDKADGAAQCRYPLPTPGALGASCSSNTDCLYSECLDSGVCSRRCVSGDHECPTGFECTNSSGINFYCTEVRASSPQSHSASCSVSSGRSPAQRPGWAWLAIMSMSLAAFAARRQRGQTA